MPGALVAAESFAICPATNMTIPESSGGFARQVQPPKTAVFARTDGATSAVVVRSVRAAKADSGYAQMRRLTSRTKGL